MAVGLAAVINMLNPSALFVHGELFAADPGLFGRLKAETEMRALGPSFAECTIVQARGSKRQGAIAAIIEYVTNNVAPTLMDDAYPHRYSNRSNTTETLSVSVSGLT